MHSHDCGLTLRPSAFDSCAGVALVAGLLPKTKLCRDGSTTKLTMRCSHILSGESVGFFPAYWDSLQVRSAWINSRCTDSSNGACYFPSANLGHMQ